MPKKAPGNRITNFLNMNQCIIKYQNCQKRLQVNWLIIKVPKKAPGNRITNFFRVTRLGLSLRKLHPNLKIFLGWKKGFRPFFGSKRQCFWQKSSIYILSNFSKNFWWLFQAKRGKICLPRQKRLQVTGLLIFWG